MARIGVAVTLQVFKRPFDELLVQLDEVEKTKHLQLQRTLASQQCVDENLLVGWRVKARNLLEMACGLDSPRYKQFRFSERSATSSNYEQTLRLRAVILAAKEDYEGGYMRSTRSLIHAELFDDELEQARELLAAGYKVAAAVIVHVVLETMHRKLCGDRNIDIGSWTR
jgi:hypothetical protein